MQGSLYAGHGARDKSMLKRERVTVVGAMSGTSLDGVDAAQIVTDGIEIFDFGPSAYHPYSAADRTTLQAALGLWPQDDTAAVSELIETRHAEALSGFDVADLIGFHGQTLAHDPGGRGTHQCGDGAVLAAVLGKPVVWDFRTSDVDMGGQGAPLAPFYHFALAKHMRATAPLAILNLGGVGNITWIDPRKAAPEDAGALLAFDTGPANAPLNDLMQTRLRQLFDTDGACAAQGTVDDAAITAFLADPYFYKIPPKSLDRDAFASLAQSVAALSDADAAATLTAAAAMAVVQAVQHCPAPPAQILVTGGGRHNPTLMAMLQAGLDCPVTPIDTAGYDGDMLEAQAFAYLAVRVSQGLPTSCPGTTGVRAAVSGGIVSRPT